MPLSVNLEGISDVYIEPHANLSNVKPMVMQFKHNGKNRFWELFSSPNIVDVMIYNSSRKVLVFIQRFEPAIYFNTIAEVDRKGKIDTVKYPLEKGVTTELCAGPVDKEIPLEEVAKETVLEKCGYLVQSVEKIGSHIKDVGYSGIRETLFYSEVTDEMKVNSRAGDSLSEVVEMTVPEVFNYVNQSDIPSPSLFLYSFYWFLSNKDKSS